MTFLAPLSLVLAVVLTIVLAMRRVPLLFIALGASLVSFIGVYLLYQNLTTPTLVTSPEGAGLETSGLIGVFLIIMGLFACITLCIIGISRGLTDASKPKGKP